jgi:hypothetical protein
MLERGVFGVRGKGETAMERFTVLVVLLLVATVDATAQVQSRPTDPPLVTAANESWYLLGEPIQFAGDVYYPAGSQVFFNGNTMVRTGHYNGVPLYADVTIEPYSIVLVPVTRGLLQPYERRRRGDLAGTTGSRAPSFPVQVVPDATSPAMAAVSPTALPLPLGAIGAYTPDTRTSVPAGPAQEVAFTTGIAAAGPVTTARRPENNDGIWIRFRDQRWVHAGPAVSLAGGDFVQVGEFAGESVYGRPNAPDVIYVPTQDGTGVAPYRLKP